MKKYLFKLVFFITISLFGGILSAEEIVKLAIGEWAPYTSEKDQKAKFAEIIVKEAFAQEGIKVVYEYYPWKRSYEYVRKGKADGTFPWTKNEERLAEFNIHKEAMFSDNGVYFHLKNLKLEWNTIQDLKKYKFGTVLGYKQEKIYEKEGLKFESVIAEEQNFKKMLVGRIDIFETSQYVGYYIINNTFDKKEAELFTHSEKPVEENNYYILFPKNERGKFLSDKFDEGLIKIKENGKFKEIEKQFF